MGFRIGERVRVKPLYPPGHVRTPYFTRGHEGVIAAINGQFADPEALAYGRDGRPARTLYRVLFAQHELWPDYDGPEGDQLIADIYETWLEPAGALTV